MYEIYGKRIFDIIFSCNIKTMFFTLLFTAITKFQVVCLDQGSSNATLSNQNSFETHYGGNFKCPDVCFCVNTEVCKN